MIDKKPFQCFLYPYQPMLPELNIPEPAQDQRAEYFKVDLFTGLAANQLAARLANFDD